MDEEQATIESQFVAYAKLFEGKTRTGETITLYHSDYWLRQANLLDDRRITMTDTEFAFRRCGADGLWLGRHVNDMNPNGWTNYTPCFPPLVQNLFYKVYDDQGDAQLKFQTAQITRYIEISGYASSLLTTLVAIYIFSVFRGLHNKRTFIHKNLFWAMFLETLIRILLYSDQLIVRDIDQLEENIKRGIENIPYLCETMYILLEYTRLVSYTWMFIQGIFVNSLVSDNTLRKPIPSIYYCLAGWIVPAIIVGIWATVTASHYSGDKIKLCWYGYNYLLSYYIVQGPILAIVAFNYIFLGCIMRVIVKKLRRLQNSELEKIKKSVRAALILMPLLGIGNVFNLFEYPLDGSATGFAIWCYVSHFLRSFQGFFVSVLYCFTNREVIRTVRKYWERCIFRMRGDQRRRRSCPHCTPDRPIFNLTDDGGPDIIPMTTLQRSQDRPSLTHHVVIEMESETRPEAVRPRATSLPVYFPPRAGLEQLSPVRIIHHTYTSHRQFTRPGLVTYDSQHRRARVMSLCV